MQATKTLALATEGLRIEQNTPSAPKGEMFYRIFGTAKAVPFQNCFACRAWYFCQRVEFCKFLNGYLFKRMSVEQLAKLSNATRRFMAKL